MALRLLVYLNPTLSEDARGNDGSPPFFDCCSSPYDYTSNEVDESGVTAKTQINPFTQTSRNY